MPKTVDLAAEFASRGEENTALTTLMIRNVPNRLTQCVLIQELGELGFASMFDFVYLPLDLRTKKNVGYAFVNFMDPCQASRCAALLQGHQLRKQSAAGKLVVSMAHIQGLEANVKHYEKSIAGSSKLKRSRPLVLPNGVESLQ